MNHFPRSALDSSLAHRFHEIASRHPDRTAIRWRERDCTYAELRERALRVAAFVRRATGAGPSAVALAAAPGLDAIGAMLGILEARAWYVPFDPSLDADALAAGLERCEAALLLTDRPALAADRRGTRCERATLEEAHAAMPSPPMLAPPGPDDLAYVYFTSGTTGTPKGVMDVHRNVLHNVMRYTNALEYGPEDRLTLLQANHFSGAVSNVFGALLNGATLLPYDVATDGAGPPLARWIERERPTGFHAVPSLLRGICGTGARFPSIRVVRLEGDAGAPADVDLFRRCFRDDAVLAHGLGATETGICRQFFWRAGDPPVGDRLPIGRDVEDIEVVLLDEEGGEVPAGAIGEIAVRSRYLAPGYWKDPARTAAAFRVLASREGWREYRTGDLGRLRADGLMEHLGRRDQQVKVRGLWVDLGEVEARLRDWPGVVEAAAGHERDATGESHLDAYLVLGGPAAPSRAEMRRFLSARLPAHAVPSRLFRVESLPLGPHAKLDRAALRPGIGAPLDEGGSSDRPRDELERGIAAIWQRVLGCGVVGIHDAFTDLGGDSLRAVEVSSAIEERFGIVLAAGALAEAGTVAELAAAMRGTSPSGPEPPIVWLRRGGRGPAVFGLRDLESGDFLFAGLSRRLADRPVAELRYPSRETFERIPRSIGRIAEGFAERIAAEGAPEGVVLVGFCFGAVVALELARRLPAHGIRLERLILLNVTPYDLGALVSPRARARFRSRWGARLRYLARKPGAMGWVRRRIVRVLGDAVGRMRLLSPIARPGGDRPVPPAIARAILREAFRRHRPVPHEGSLTLFVAEETLPLYADDAGEAWAPIATGRLELRRLPHDGYAMLQEPDVEQVARAVTDFAVPAP